MSGKFIDEFIRYNNKGGEVERIERKGERKERKGRDKDRREGSGKDGKVFYFLLNTFGANVESKRKKKKKKKR